MRRTVILAVLLMAGVLMACGTAGARQELMTPDRTPDEYPRWPNTQYFSDDMESSAPGWTHGDFTATAAPHFHVDTYYAWSGGAITTRPGAWGTPRWSGEPCQKRRTKPRM